jgi:hypothetical protein
LNFETTKTRLPYFAGPLPKSKKGNQYVLVMVEYFSKTVVLVPTRDKEPATVAEAFTRMVLTRYGAPAEVVTDRGGEFGGVFQECLDAALVEYRATSAYHPQANGLSERVAQVVKRALRKWCLGHPAEEWDVFPAVGSHGRVQLHHTGILGGLLALQAVARAGSGCARDGPGGGGRAPGLGRQSQGGSAGEGAAALFRRWMPMAMANLQIAQHRDTLWYAHTRSGGWKPQVVQYAVGEFVYLQREMVDTLDTRAGVRILRVKKMAPNGVLELEGSDARTVRVHMERCAPCHWVDIDERVNPRVAVPLPSFAYTWCRKSTGAARVLLCDGCGAGWHLECLAVPLGAIPEGDWYCDTCKEGQGAGPLAILPATL